MTVITMGVAPRILPQLVWRQILFQIRPGIWILAAIILYNLPRIYTKPFFSASPQNVLPSAAGKFTIARVNAIWQSESVIAHTQILARSLKHLTGRDLLAGNFSPAELAEKIFHAPFVLVSHGTEADPVLNYGNAAALALWEMSWAELTRTPSRLTAEAPNREERARLLAAVTAARFH